jgi:hypothetical protein
MLVPCSSEFDRIQTWLIAGICPQRLVFTALSVPLRWIMRRREVILLLAGATLASSTIVAGRAATRRKVWRAPKKGTHATARVHCGNGGHCSPELWFRWVMDSQTL